ncbi:uncharacterized protein LOC133784573 [Humulus lupulus]|uniref:uncharacterized protein LOC133784573 n=1 Tax=Humulus lupulus TaxID=3486 RepID=UPI002B4071E0|nr:uncharacterized protein LOC133784573 [Humulus lupulus]
MQSLALPKFVVIKSRYNGKYLRRISVEESIQKGLPPTFLNFQGEDITSPFVKFEVERAKKDPELVHIRCCHNNKYLAAPESNSWWVMATADQPVEDDGRSSTMFKPIKTDEFDNEEYFRFFHPGSGHYACLWRAAKPHDDGLIAAYSSKDGDHCDVYKVLDWESLVIFPKTIVGFKMQGTENKYLSYRWIEGHPYLQFVPNDIADQTTGNEISSFGDGYIRIRNLSTGKFWRRSPNWIWADSSDTTGNDKDTLFWPIKLSDNVVALRNLGNNYFCKSLTTEGKTECLNAGVPSITDEAKLEVVEGVISRSIYDLNFRPEDGRIYNVKVIEKAHEAAENNDDVENTMALKFSYKDTSSSTLGGSVSLKLGVKTTLQVDTIPLIFEGKIELSAECTGTHQWGSTNTVETLTESTYTVKVPPKTRVIVTLVASKGTCDVPFSYTRRDLLYNGNTIMNNLDDGIYTGVNTFNVDFQSRHEKLP